MSTLTTPQQILSSPNALPSTLPSQTFAAPAEVQKTFGEKVASLGSAATWDTFSAGLNNNLAAWIARAGESFSYDTDPEFQLTPELLRFSSQGIDPDLTPMFSRARSEQHLDALREQAASITASRQQLAESGWGGTVAMLAGNIADPTTVASMAIGPLLGGGGAAVEAVNASRLARVAGMARAGLVNASTSAALESIRLSVDPNADARMFVSSIASDAFFGAGIGSFVQKRLFARALAGSTLSAAGPIVSMPFATDDDALAEVQAEVLTNFVTGTVYGSLHSRPKLSQFDAGLVKAAENANDRVNVASARAMGAPLTPQGEAHFSNVVGRVAIAEDAADLWHIGGVHPDDAAELMGVSAATEVPPVAFTVDAKAAGIEKITAGGPGPTGGTPAQNPLLRPNAKPGDIDLSRATDARVDMRSITLPGGKKIPLRFSMAALTGNSQTPFVRLVGNMLGTDTLAKSDGMGIVGAIEQRDARVRSRSFSVVGSLADDYRTYAKANGKNALSATEFRAEVSKAQRRMRPDGTVMGDVDPHVLAAAKKLAVAYADDFDYARRHNVPGTQSADDAYKAYIADAGSRGPKAMTRDEFDAEVRRLRGVPATERGDINPHVEDALHAADFDQTYVPRMGNRPEIDHRITVGGLDRLVDAVTPAVMSRMTAASDALFPTLEKERLTKLARRMARAWVTDIGTRHESRWLGEMTSEDFDALVSQRMPDMAKDDVNTLRRILFGDSEKGVTPRLMRRMPLDETYVHTYQDTGEQLAIESLLQNDAEALYTHYLSRTTGLSAFAEVSRVARALTGEKFSTLDQLLATIKRLAPDEDGNHARVEAMARRVLGLPVWEPKSGFSRHAIQAARVLMNWNFFKNMSTPVAGMWNKLDVVRAASHPDIGYGSVARAFPAIEELRKAVISGTLPDEPLVKYALSLGLGTSRITQRAEASFIMEEGLGQRLSGIERGSRKLANATADFSLQKPIQDAGELILAAGAMQRWLDIAQGGKPMSAKRLAQLGISEPMAKRIADEMRRHAVKDGNRLVHPNVDDWLDKEAAMTFEHGVTRLVRRELNVGDESQAARWMSHPIARIATQFRVYPLRAWENVTLPASQVGWKHAASRYIMGSALGALGQIMAVGIQGGLGLAATDPDFFEKRLSPEEISKAAIGRAAWTSLLPTGFDMALALGDEQPIFAQQRITGLGADNGAISLLTGNPTLDLIRNAAGSLSLLRVPLDPSYDLSQRNMRAVQGAFLPNLPTFRAAVQAFSENLPRESKPKQR